MFKGREALRGGMPHPRQVGDLGVDVDHVSALAVQHVSRRIATAETVAVEYLVQGEGQPIVLLPSAGRAADDFDDTAFRLAGVGFRVIRPQPRGIGASAGLMVEITLHDLAADVAFALEAEGMTEVIAVGHAFGSMVARTLATDRRDLVRGVVIAASSGRLPPDARRLGGVAASSDLSVPDFERLPRVAEAFFAPGSDASAFLHGWHPAALEAQLSAVHATPFDEYIAAGGAPILDMHADSDFFVPLEHLNDLRDELGAAQVSVVLIPGAGHALFPEQPTLVVKAIVEWARALVGESALAR
jgi:pimeloyl-ACP methyl ester carboxylesterase